MLLLVQRGLLSSLVGRGRGLGGGLLLAVTLVAVPLFEEDTYRLLEFIV